MATLNGLSLGGCVWMDEFEFTPVVQSVRYTLGGQARVEASRRYAGRPITLECPWQTRAVIRTLEGWRDVPGATYPLVLDDARVFDVIFRQDAAPVVAVPIVPYSALGDEDLLSLTLNLQVV